MPLPDLTPLQGARPPFASVTLDVSATDPANRDDVDLRWREAARSLEDAGAPAEVIDRLAGPATAPTGLGGELTRVLVGDGEDVLVDRLLSGRPTRPDAGYGPVPRLMELARAAALFVPHVVVRLDRSGADITVCTSPDGRTAEREVEGDHDVLHKVPGGGWAQRRWEARAEDSWERNAEQVAAELDSLCRRHRLDVVVVEGDDKAWPLLRDAVSPPVRERLVRLERGGRAPGSDSDAEQDAVEEILTARRLERTRGVLDRYAEQHAREERAVEGLAAVVDALRRGQVEHLLLRDDPSSTMTLWVGQEPLQVGTTAQEVRDAGADEPVEVRADAAITWALAGSGADLVLVEDEPVDLVDGVGALLRWTDEATPHDSAPLVPEHREARGATDEPA